MKFYLKNAGDVLNELKTTARGLSSAEAERRLETSGKNKLAEGKRKSMAARFIEQLLNPMVLVLIAAAVISAVTAAIAGESFADVFIIMAVVIINSVLGVVQESKAEKAIEALKEMASSTSKVLRDGNIRVIKSEDLVPGDVVLLEAGDAVPADSRIIESASLKVDEAALTGESVPVEKNVAALAAQPNGDITLGDRRNMVYTGSSVVYGRGSAVVCGTGMNTEMGKIADAITNAQQSQTPLQIKMASLSKTLSYLVLGICLFVFIFAFVKTGDMSASTALSSFMLAVSLAVAAIPEGLAAVVTIVLSIGVTKMSKHNAIIRRLTAVETLGCTQIICSDKTGTLTQNKMTVVETFGDDKPLLAEAMALASDAEWGTDGTVTGEPTECALVNYAAEAGLPKNKLTEKAPRIGEAPFDSMRKMMSTVHKTEGGIIQYTKGAPDEVLKRCTSYVRDGKVYPINDAALNEIITANKTMAKKALRVLAAAMRIYSNNGPAKYTSEVLERDLTFVGLTGMIDPIRPEVIGAIAECRSAGIRPIMITGDHLDTAVSIAAEIGILKDASQAITGSQLSEIDDKTFTDNVEKYSVYARVQPDHKVRIVKAWRERGYITAMTGDGVNDAPSIKSADIGIGMGITGTDVTKNVADMILADDNFATIVKAVQEGRRIYDNVRKAINFLLSSNLSEVIAIFTATIMGFTILKPIHLLWINLITDSLPALALGMEKEEPGLMSRKPRSSKEGLFANGAGFTILYQGIAVAALTIAAYFIGHYIESGYWEITESRDGITMAFLTMNMAEIFHSYNMRSQEVSLLKLKTHNFYLFGAMLASLVLTGLVIYVPFLRDLFSLEYIDFTEYIIALGLAFLIIPIVETVKFIRRAAKKNK
jgi:Ca2+-transporting ATPase